MKWLLFLSPVFFAVSNIQNCPDRWALTKDLDVWTHRRIGGKGEHLKSISLYDLDDHEMIEVIKGNVSVLCDGMIRDLKHLKYLTLIEANISKIQPEAFRNLPKLTQLSLAVNHLTSVSKHYFENLKSLRILYLSDNQIEDVKENAFADLPNLRKIFLDRNKIFEIDSNWFLSNERLILIDLSFNKISKLQKGAFTLPKNSMVEIRLQTNEIEEVEAGAVISTATEEEVPYLTLHLDRNNLTDITADFVKSMDVFQSKLYFDNNNIRCFIPETLKLLKEVSLELHANSNPFSCDCLEAATNFVNDHELTAKFVYSSSVECQLPGFRPNQWYTAPNF